VTRFIAIALMLGALAGLWALTPSHAQNSLVGGIGAGETAGGLGGAVGFGIVAGTVGSAPSPPTGCAIGSINLSLGCPQPMLGL
jgi:hypothetical protein